MNPSARSALTLAVLLVLPQLQALCPRLAPDVISGKVIPCRYLCIKINFLELPSIVLSTERDGVLCSTLLLRRRGVCKNGGCMPFGSDDDIKPKGALGKVIAAIDKFASGSYRTKAPKPGTPFGPIVSTASSLFGGGSSKTSGSSSTSSAASSLVATATAAAVGSTFKKLLTHGAAAFSEKKKHDEHPFSSLLPSVSKPDHHPEHTPGGTVSSSSGAVAVSFGGGPPVLPPSTEGGAANESPHGASGTPSMSSQGTSEHPSLPPFISPPQHKPKESLSPGSPSGAPSSNGNVIKHAIGLVLGTIAGSPTSGTPSRSVGHDGPIREASGGGGATPTEFPFGRVQPTAPFPPSAGTGRDGKERLPGISASSNVIEPGHPPMAPAAATITNIGYNSKPSLTSQPSSLLPPIESQAPNAALQAGNSRGSQLNSPYGVAFSRLREISQGSSRNTLPGQPSSAAFGGMSVPSSGSAVTTLHKGASGAEVNHNKGTDVNLPSVGATRIAADYGHGHPSVLPSAAGVFESKRPEAPQWPGPPEAVSRPINAPTQAAGVSSGTSLGAPQLIPSKPVSTTSPLMANAPFRPTPTYASESSSGSLLKLSLANTLSTSKQVPAAATPVIPARQPLSAARVETPVPASNTPIGISHKGVNMPEVMRKKAENMRPLSGKPAPAAVEFGSGLSQIPPSSIAVAENKGAEGSQPSTVPSTIPRPAVIAAATAQANLARIRGNSEISLNKYSSRPSPSIGSSGQKVPAASGSTGHASTQTERTFENALNTLRPSSGTTGPITSLKRPSLVLGATFSEACKGSIIQNLPGGAKHQKVKPAKQTIVGALEGTAAPVAVVLGGVPPSVAPSAMAQAAGQGAKASQLSPAPNRKLQLGLVKPAEAGLSTGISASGILNRHETKPSPAIGSIGLALLSASKSTTAVRMPTGSTLGVASGRVSNNATPTSPLRQLSAHPPVETHQPNGSPSIQGIHTGPSTLEVKNKKNTVLGVLLGSSKRRNEQLGSGAPTLPSPIIGATDHAARTSPSSTTQYSALQPTNMAAAASQVLTTPSAREQRSEADAGMTKQGIDSLAHGSRSATKDGTTATSLSISRSRSVPHAALRSGAPLLSGAEIARKTSISTTLTLSKNVGPGELAMHPGQRRQIAHSSLTKSAALPGKPGSTSGLPSLPATKKGSAAKSSGSGSGASRVRPKKHFFRGFFRRFKHKRKQHHRKIEPMRKQGAKGNAATPSRNLDSTKSKTGTLLSSGVKGSTVPGPQAAVSTTVPNLLSLPPQRTELPSSRRGSTTHATKSTVVESPISKKSIINTLAKTKAELLSKSKSATSTHKKASSENNVNRVSSSHGAVETKVIDGANGLSTKEGRINLPNRGPATLQFGAPSGPTASRPSTTQITPTNSALRNTAILGNKQGLAFGQNNEKKPLLTVPTGTTEPTPNKRAKIEGLNKPYSILSTRTPTTKEQTLNSVSPGSEVPSRHGSASFATVTETKIASPGVSSISHGNTVATPSKPPATTGTPSSTISGNHLEPKPIAPQQIPATAVAAASKGGNASYGQNQGFRTSLPRTPGTVQATRDATWPNMRVPRGSVTSTTVTGTQNASAGVSSISQSNTVATPSRPTTTTGTPPSAQSGIHLTTKPIASQQNPAPAVAAASKSRNAAYGSSQGSQTSLQRTPGLREATPNAILPSIKVPSPGGSVTSTTITGTGNASPGVSSISHGNNAATFSKPTATAVTPSNGHSGNHLEIKPKAQDNHVRAEAAASKGRNVSNGINQGPQKSGQIKKTVNAHSTGGTLNTQSVISSQRPSSTSGRVSSQMSPSKDNSSKARLVLTAQSMDGASRASEKRIISGPLPASSPTSVSTALGTQSASSTMVVNVPSRMAGTPATTAASEKHVPKAGSLSGTKGSASSGPGAPLVPNPTSTSTASGVLLAPSVRNNMAANRLSGTLGTAGTTEKHTPTASSLSGLKRSVSLIRAEKGVETPRPSSPKPANAIANVRTSSTSGAQTGLVSTTPSRPAAPNLGTPPTTSSSTANFPATATASKANFRSSSPQTAQNAVTKGQKVAAPGSASNFAANAPMISAHQNVKAPQLLAVTTANKSANNVPKSEPRLRSLAIAPKVNASNNAKTPAVSAGSVKTAGTNSKDNTAPVLSPPGGKPIGAGPVTPEKVLKVASKPFQIIQNLRGISPDRRGANVEHTGSSAVSNPESVTATNKGVGAGTEARPATAAQDLTQPTAPVQPPSQPNFAPSNGGQATPNINVGQQGPSMYPGMQQQGGMIFGRPPMPGGFWGPAQGMGGMFRPF